MSFSPASPPSDPKPHSWLLLDEDFAGLVPCLSPMPPEHCQPSSSSVGKAPPLSAAPVPVPPPPPPPLPHPVVAAAASSSSAGLVPAPHAVPKQPAVKSSAHSHSSHSHSHVAAASATTSMKPSMSSGLVPFRPLIRKPQPWHNAMAAFHIVSNVVTASDSQQPNVQQPPLQPTIVAVSNRKPRKRSAEALQ